MVPDAFARITVRREGDAGQRWIDELPDLVTELTYRCTAPREVPEGTRLGAP